MQGKSANCQSPTLERNVASLMYSLQHNKTTSTREWTESENEDMVVSNSVADETHHEKIRKRC